MIVRDGTPQEKLLYFGERVEELARQIGLDTWAVTSQLDGLDHYSYGPHTRSAVQMFREAAASFAEIAQIVEQEEQDDESYLHEEDLTDDD